MGMPGNEGGEPVRVFSAGRWHLLWTSFSWSLTSIPDSRLETLFWVLGTVRGLLPSLELSPGPGLGELHQFDFLLCSERAATLSRRTQRGPENLRGGWVAGAVHEKLEWSRTCGPPV